MSLTPTLESQGGEALVTAIREVRPDIPVLFCSAYKPDNIVVPGVIPEILDKPVDPSNLAKYLRLQLDMFRHP